VLVRRTVEAGRGDPVQTGHQPALTGDGGVLDGLGDGWMVIGTLRHGEKLYVQRPTDAHLQAGPSSQ
jgi:hypothetical protein